MQKVLVVDKYKRPLMPCQPARARELLKKGRMQKGFQTGDIVKATVTKGKKTGIHIGRVAVRSSGSFNITTSEGTVQGIGYRYCTHLHQSDGYSYQKGKRALIPIAKARGFRA